MFPKMLDAVVLRDTVSDVMLELHSLSDSMRRALARWQIHSELNISSLIYSEL